MSKRMLIDASHPEETRVVVLDGHKVEEFDFESASRRPLKGNIYLAKVTRVEPSLQAAFVEYGGNRQGFLAFSEVHPDYYQIPVADRQALLADQSRRLIEEDEEVDSVATNVAPSKPGILAAEATGEDIEEAVSEAAAADADQNAEGADDVETDSSEPQDLEISDSDALPSPDTNSDANSDAGRDSSGDSSADDDPTQSDEDKQPLEATPIENDQDGTSAQSSEDDGLQSETKIDAVDAKEEIEAEPAKEENDKAEEGSDTERPEVLAESTGTPATMERKSRRKRPPRRRHYKIQEVMRRKQIILVQVVKEERGNKGASLTTYLSLAGRYCVLMPNTPRGGGISRKITSMTDRKRLKSAAQSLELPEGMGVIIRTAGANRTKAEIKRDYEYLLRLWDSVRELTLKSNAPALVYEEGNLIKRTIRDLYGKEVSEVTVDGEAGYRDAKDFMRMIMPSHAKNVKLYKEGVSLFQRFQVDDQLDAMFSPVVTLKSGGYIVINQTEALVSIDVNSGKATREHSIEETARKTNLEAADEIGRQLRLRDLAGLVVIDFIDMDDGKNDRSVEKRLRDAVRNDRARIQIGKISQFGLLEMSRQRLRAGVLAGSTLACPHCEGLGYIRSTESASLQLLRALDEEGQQQNAVSLIARAPDEIIIYTLNHKRAEISRIEQSYEMSIAFETKGEMSGGTFEIERVGKRPPSKQRKLSAVSIEAGFKDQEEEEVEEKPSEAEEGPAEAEAAQESEQSGESDGRKRRRRRRRGGRGRGQQNSDAAPEGSEEAAAPSESVENLKPEAAESNAEPAESEDTGEHKKRRRRRGRRGRRPDKESGTNAQSGAINDAKASDAPGRMANAGAAAGNAEKKTRALQAVNLKIAEPAQTSAPPSAPTSNPAPGDSNVEAPKEIPIPAIAAENKESAGASKKGWWQRKLGI